MRTERRLKPSPVESQRRHGIHQEDLGVGEFAVKLYVKIHLTTIVKIVM